MQPGIFRSWKDYLKVMLALIGLWVLIGFAIFSVWRILCDNEEDESKVVAIKYIQKSENVRVYLF